MTANILLCSLLVAIAYAGDQGTGYINQGSRRIVDDRLGGRGLRHQGVSNINNVAPQGYSSGAAGGNRLGRNSLGGKTSLLGGRSRALSNNGLRSLTSNDGYRSQGTSAKSASFRSVGAGISNGVYGNDRNIGSGVHQSFGGKGISNTHDIGTGAGTGYANNRLVSGNDGFNGNSLSSSHGNEGLRGSNAGYGNDGISGIHPDVHQDSFGDNSLTNIHSDTNQNRRLPGLHDIGNQNTLGSRGLSDSHSIVGQGIGQSIDGYNNDGISASRSIGNQDNLHSGANNVRLSNIHDQDTVNGGYDNTGRFNRGQSFVRNNDLNNGGSYVAGPLRKSSSLLRGGSNIHGDINSNNGLIGNKGSRNVFNRPGLRSHRLNDNDNVFRNSGSHGINNRRIGLSGNGYDDNRLSGVNNIGNKDIHGGRSSFSGDHSLGTRRSFGSNAISNSHPLISQGQSYGNDGISGSNVIRNQGLLHPNTRSTNFRLSKPRSIGRLGNGRTNFGNSHSGGSLGRTSGALSGGKGVHGVIQRSNGLINNRRNDLNRPGLTSGVHNVGGNSDRLGYNDVLSVGSGIHNVGSGRGSLKFRNTGGTINRRLGSSRGNVGHVNNDVNTLHGSVVPVDHFNNNNDNIHGGGISRSRSVVGDHGIVDDLHRNNLGGSQGYSDNNRQVSFGSQNRGRGIVHGGIDGGTSGYNGINDNVHGGNNGLVRGNNLIAPNDDLHGIRRGAQGYDRTGGIGNVGNNNLHDNRINNNGYSEGVVGNRRIADHNLNNGGVVGHPRGTRGSNIGRRDCLPTSDLGKNFDFSDSANNFPREKIIRELQSRPHLRTRMGIDGAFVSKDFEVLTGFGQKRVHRRKRSADSSFDSGFGDESAFDTPSNKVFDLQSSQQRRLARLVKPNAEVCPSNRRPLRSFNMNGARCFTINRKDRPTMFATCTRRECPECSRNRGVGRCMEEFEKASVFAWCDGDSFSNNIREVSLLVPKHCGGKSYNC